MSEPFVLQTGSARWVVHPPYDPYGDGYVFRAVMELHDDGMTSSADAGIDGVSVHPKVGRLPLFVQALADDWRGWSGARTWASMDRDLVIDAQHDGRGHVSFAVTLRGPGCFHMDDTAWTARVVFSLEAGEEMTRLASDLTDFLRT